MTSERETEANLESRPAQPASAEVAYDRLTAYGFARRYVKGKVVADVGGGSAGHGSRLLMEDAESVTDLAGPPETAELASAVYDVVVAFGVIEDSEHPEGLLKEAKRLLKEDGVLLVSALDKQANTIERDPASPNGGRREMYVSEFQEMLERHFGQVRIYRQGAIAGGIVFPVTQEVGGAPVEVARFSVAEERLGVGSLETRSVIAVCSDAAEALGDEGQPYLLLDGDRRVYEEHEGSVEDVELLRAEVRRMQETEVQAFVDAIKVRKSLIQELPRYMPHMRNMILEHLIHRRNIIRGNIYAIRRKGAMGLARGALRRSSAFYRRLQARTRDSD